MPRGDRTGPAGAGPMTGRAAGFCAGFGAPGYANPGAGNYPGGGWRGRGFFRGSGRGFGRLYPYGAGAYGWGAGYGRGYYTNPFDAGVNTAYDPDVERKYLENEKKNLEYSLEAVKKQMEELDSDASGRREGKE